MTDNENAGRAQPTPEANLNGPEDGDPPRADSQTSDYTPGDEHRVGEPRLRRARWTAIALAAVLVLVVVGGAVIVRSDGEPSDSAASADPASYVLPPDGVEVTAATAYLPVGGESASADEMPTGDALDSYAVWWLDSSGNGVFMSVTRPEDAFRYAATPELRDQRPGVPGDADELATMTQTIFVTPDGGFDSRPVLPVDASGLEPAVFACFGSLPDNAAPLVAGIADQSWLVTLTDSPTSIGRCTTSPEDDRAVLAASRGLRLVSEQEWLAFMREAGAVEPALPPPTTPPPPTTLDPSLVPYCEAVEHFRKASPIDNETGDPLPSALPLMEEIRDSAPEEIRAPLDAMITWLEDGAVPSEKTSAVDEAEVTMTRDWAARCPAGPE